MKRRDFNRFVLASSAMGLTTLPLGVTRAQGQTTGGTLNAILQPEPPMLNLAVNQQTPTQTISGKIFLSLLTYDFDLKPVPSLAKSWDVSADGISPPVKK